MTSRPRIIMLAPIYCRLRRRPRDLGHRKNVPTIVVFLAPSCAPRRGGVGRVPADPLFGVQPAPPLAPAPGALPHPVPQLRGQEELPRSELRRDVQQGHLLQAGQGVRRLLQPLQGAGDPFALQVRPDEEARKREIIGPASTSARED